MLRSMLSRLAVLSFLFWPSHAFGADRMIIPGTTRLPAFTIYRAGPASASIGILLAPRLRGVTPDLQFWADRLGHDGYRVVVIDPYDGRVFHSKRRAQKAAAKLDPGTIRAEARAVLRLLMAPGRKLITVGWGPFGGHQALMDALADPALVSATIIYHDHTHLISNPHQLVRLKEGVLAVFFGPPGKPAVERFEAAMRLAGKPLYVHFYPGRVRMRELGSNPSNNAAQLAWNETVGFIGDVQRYCRRCIGLYGYRR